MPHHVFRFPNGLGVSILTRPDTPHPSDDAEACVIRLADAGAYEVTSETARLDAHEVTEYLSSVAARRDAR